MLISATSSATLLHQDEVFRQHATYRERLIGWIERHGRVDLLTLGPKETSSCHAARYFSSYVEQILPRVPCQLDWRTSFDEVYRGFKSGAGGLLLVPNAYEGITEMYWDGDLRFLYCFYCDTPPYGLAVRSRADLERPVLRLATCPAVRNLIGSRGRELLDGRATEIVTVPSTTAAARCVAEGGADVAITNLPGGTRHGLEFVTPLAGVMMLWSLFRRAEGLP